MAAEAAANGAPDSAAILDLLATAILVVDARSNVLALNQAAADLLATSPGAARGRPLAALVADGTAIEQLLARSRASEERLAVRDFALAPAARGDARYQVDVTLTPLPGTLPGGVLLEIADTTGPSRMTRDAALLVQQGGSRVMARQLAHEIKNPLGGLRGAAQLLERELPSQELREYTRVIIGEADRLCALVDSLLGPARPVRREVRQRARGPRPRVSARARRGARGRRDRARLRPEPAAPRTRPRPAGAGDAEPRAERRAGARQRRTADAAEPRADERDDRNRSPPLWSASLQFEDDGPGVPPELGETIFYPLVTARAGGTGLGLAVAQDIATRHGGIIEFDSRPGRTVFSLLLPLENGHDEAA